LRLCSPGALAIVCQFCLNIFRNLEIWEIKEGRYGNVGFLFSFCFKGSTLNA
jgi:hypothetical protein